MKIIEIRINDLKDLEDVFYEHLTTIEKQADFYAIFSHSIYLSIDNYRRLGANDLAVFPEADFGYGGPGIYVPLNGLDVEQDLVVIKEPDESRENVKDSVFRYLLEKELNK